MFGHLLPARPAPFAEEEAERALAEVLLAMEPDTRQLILLGLLRPRAILVGGYTASGHRSCPLASAVWEATGHEATTWADVQTGITALGLGELHHRFYGAFDDWAAAGCYQIEDSDGSQVLSAAGRYRLVEIIEQLH